MLAYFCCSGSSAVVKEALMFICEHFSSVGVTRLGTLWTWLLIADEIYLLGSDTLLQSFTPSRWEQCKRNICSKPWHTSFCLSNVDSVCVQGSQAIDNYSRSHGCSQLVLCPLPLTLPSKFWKACPRSDDLCN